MPSLAEYFEANRPKPKYNFGDRVSGKCWGLNKIDRISYLEASVFLLENRIIHSTLCGASELTG